MIRRWLARRAARRERELQEATREFVGWMEQRRAHYERIGCHVDPETGKVTEL